MKTRKQETIIYLIPILILLCIHPVFLRLYEYDNGLGDYAWMGTSEGNMDLFLHGKMILFECICVACLVFGLHYIYCENKRLHLSKPFALLGGYAVLAIVSTVMSEYRRFGFSGIDEQFENIWCLLGYVLIVIYVYLMVQNHHGIQFLLYGLLIGALIIGVIGLSQFAGHDILMTDIAKLCYIPDSLRGTLVNIAFGIGTVYATLYNPGYVGLYTSLICPILIIMIFYHQKKTVRTLSVIACILLVISTIGSQTIGGYIGLGISFFVLLVMMMRKCTASKKSIFLTAITCVSLIIIVLGFQSLQAAITQTLVQDEPSVTNTENDTNTYNVYELANNSATAELDSQYNLNSIQETDDYVEFCYNGIYFRESMRVESNAVYLDFTDQQNQSIAYDYDANSMVYTLTEPGLEGIISYSVNILDTYIGFVTNIDGKDWTFTYTYKDDELSYYTINALNKLDKNVTSKSAVFTNHYRIFNGRGYIWAKTIPLLKKYILLGSGADSFTLVFPQSDYLSAYKGGYENMIITKPHCIYLQSAVQTGLLSMVLLLMFYFIYLFDCLKLYFMKQITDDQAAYAVAIFAGTTGFLVLSLINDSTICVTPVFCALLGMGLALNRINRSRQLNR